MTTRIEHRNVSIENDGDAMVGALRFNSLGKPVP